MLRASSLPALSECPCFESGNSDLDEARTESGTDRHTALQKHFAGDDSLLELLPEEDQDAIRWAAEYIRIYAPMSEYPLTWEKENSGVAIATDFIEIPGTPDAICALDIFDLKWRPRNYTAQMACYALMRLQATNPNVVIRVHLLFGCFKKAEVLKFDYESASAIVDPIAKEYTDPNKQPNPCGYCGWCANRLTCSALNDRAQTIAAGREDWKLEQYHTSEITKPDQMAKALMLARHLKEWVKAVEYHAKEMVLKQGVTIPGYELKSKKGRSSCADATGAFNALKVLSADEFLQCCEVRLNTSKDNPDKKGLIDLFKQKKEISGAVAKREVTNLLKPFMRTPKETMSLKAINSVSEEEETNETPV